MEGEFQEENIKRRRPNERPRRPNPVVLPLYHPIEGDGKTPNSLTFSSTLPVNWRSFMNFNMRGNITLIMCTSFGDEKPKLKSWIHYYPAGVTLSTQLVSVSLSFPICRKGGNNSTHAAEIL